MDFAKLLREKISKQDWPEFADYAIILNTKLHWVGGGFVWKGHGFLQHEEFKEMEHFACSRERFFM